MEACVLDSPLSFGHTDKLTDTETHRHTRGHSMGGVLVGGPIQKIPIQNKYNENGEAFHRFFHRGVDGRSPISSMDVVISRIRIFVYFRRPVVVPKRLHIYAHIYLCAMCTCIYVWMCLCLLLVPRAQTRCGSH